MRRILMVLLVAAFAAGSAFAHGGKSHQLLGTVKELHVERKVRLLYSKARTLSHAARAFLELVLTPT